MNKHSKVADSYQGCTRHTICTRLYFCTRLYYIFTRLFFEKPLSCTYDKSRSVSTYVI